MTGKTGEELGLIAVNGKVMDTLPAELCCVQVRSVHPRAQPSTHMPSMESSSTFSTILSGTLGWCFTSTRGSSQWIHGREQSPVKMVDSSRPTSSWALMASKVSCVRSSSRRLLHPQIAITGLP